MAIHVAVGHAKLGLLLKDHELVQSKRNAVISGRPNKVAIGETCPICEQVWPLTQLFSGFLKIIDMP